MTVADAAVADLAVRLVSLGAMIVTVVILAARGRPR